MYRVQLNEEQLTLWHEEEDSSGAAPAGLSSHAVKSNKSTGQATKANADTALPQVSGEKRDHRERSEQEQDQNLTGAETVDMERHLLACRTSLVNHSTQLPSESQVSIDQAHRFRSVGLKAHITLGCRDGVRPMQTGPDQVASPHCVFQPGLTSCISPSQLKLLRGTVVEEVNVPGGVLARCSSVFN